jgi:hypothetical protein
VLLVKQVPKVLKGTKVFKGQLELQEQLVLGSVMETQRVTSNTGMELDGRT